MNFKTLIIFSIIVQVIISKNEIYNDEYDNIDLIPGEEKKIENIKPILEFGLPLRAWNNDITIKIPKVEHTISVEYCGLQQLSIIEYLDCINRAKTVQINEREESEEYIISGQFTINAKDYKYVAIQVATNGSGINYLKIKVDQNAGSFISIGLIIFTALLSFI